MTPLRRKFKLLKLFLLFFFIVLAIEIYRDYQVLNFIHEAKGTSSLLFTGNTTFTERVRLKSIVDITTNVDITRYNLNLRKIYDSTEVISTETELEKEKKTENTNQIALPIMSSEQMANNDSRPYYNPSFKNKMEEALREKMESFQALSNGTVEGVPNSSIEKPMSQVNHPIKAGTGKPLEAKTDDSPSKEEDAKLKSKQQTYSVPKAADQLMKNLRKLKSKLGKNPTNKNPTRKTAIKSTKKVFKVSHVVDVREISLNETELATIEDRIRKENERQLVYNRQRFGPLKNEDTVILVQVHNRLSNLQLLVESFGQVKHMNSTLVIFSHDFWDESMNAFVHSIREFRVMQIFFPFSIQLNPHKFPGRDPRDCTWNSEQKAASSRACLNIAWPDSYGHFREAAFTQLKHHWWWKLVRVFKHLHELRDFTGQVLFLEEDHYVAPDLLHTLRILQKERDKSYKDHLVLALGNYDRKSSLPANAVERGEWVVNKFNLGFAFDRRVFDIILKCQDSFCRYDDYNWDWTLTTLAKTCAQNKIRILSVKLPRVFHIGSCGTHVRQKNCNLAKEVNVVKTRIQSNMSKLFPTSLSIQAKFKTYAKPKKSNGGWGDLRDKQLCVAISNGTNIDVVLNNLQFRNVTKL